MTIVPPEGPSVSRQVGEAAARAALSAIPLAGGAAVEVFTAATQRGYRKRFDLWMSEVSDAVNRLVLEPRGLDWSSLESNDGFLDAIAHATRSATQTSSAEKRAALRAAVVNAAGRPELDADRTAILLDLLDALTASHLRMLALFADPRGWFEARDRKVPGYYISGSRTQLLREAYPEIEADRTLTDKLASDLATHGLASLSLHTMMTGSGVLEPAVLPLGLELLALVTEPEAPLA